MARVIGKQRNHSNCKYFVLPWSRELIVCQTRIGKYFTVDNFFKKLNLLDVFVHAVENTNLAYPVEDWDKQKGDVAHFRQKSREVWQEIFTTITINIFWAFIKLIPMFYTGKRFPFTILSLPEVHTYNLPMHGIYIPKTYFMSIKIV